MQNALVWIRRDLRLHDHAPLAAAASAATNVAMAFVFDPNILNKLKDKNDRRLTFIHESLRELDENLRARGSRLLVRIGDPVQEIPKLAREINAAAVFTGQDYEPYAKKRDAAVAKAMAAEKKQFHAVKDQVIFEGMEVQSQTGTAFKVFTPYKNAWLKRLHPGDYDERDTSRIKFLPAEDLRSPDWSLQRIGFEAADLWLKAGENAGRAGLTAFAEKIDDYSRGRDFPALAGTSCLSVHLRFGTISIRECVRLALSRKGEGASIWLSELIWRDFYHMILDQYPRVEKHAFKEEYEKISWPGKSEHFRAWCEGRTGFPLVDAAMRHFNRTGWMHNRLRMVVASFLTKDLLVSWQKGEDYFARYLLDFDLAANNGGWQWSASTGCDAQPYFRIFNPTSQSEKFDPNGAFIRENIPELAGVPTSEIHAPGARNGYPAPIVDHSVQREKAIALFKK